MPILPRTKAMITHFLFRFPASICFISVLNACSPSTPPSPAHPLPEQFSTAGTAPLPDQWWTTFRDPHLNLLVAHSLKTNLTLREAWNRLSEAQAIARRESAPLLPALDIFVEADRFERRLGGFDDQELEDGGGGDEVVRRVDAGLMASYELDLWGRIRASARAERFRSEAAYADYQTAAITLSAEVARTWFRLLEAKNRLSVLTEQAKTNEDARMILEAQFGNGQVRRADILRQEQLLEETRAQIYSTEELYGVLGNQLAVLLGKAPQQDLPIEPETELPGELPPLPDTGIPAELVQRRPDVQRAYLELQAADEELAAAVRDQYPRITLSATFFSSDEGDAKLFDDWLKDLTASLVLPIFDGGRRSAEVDRTTAVKQQRFNQYGQSILTAFQDVEDALVQEEKRRERLESVEKQLQLASTTYDLLQQQYFNGTGAYIDVLDSLTDSQELERELLFQRLALLEARLSLYRALSGGFHPKSESRDNPSGNSGFVAELTEG